MTTNDDFISVDTLKEQGLTDDDFKDIIQPDPDPTPTPDPVVDPVPDPTPTPDPAPTTDPDPVPDHDSVSKHVPYDRFKEVNDKYKALRAELEALKQQPAPQPQPIYQQPPAAPVPPIDLAEKIAEIADHEVRRKFNITGDIEELQMQDPKLYAKYIKEVAKTELKLETKIDENARLQYENDKFVNELGSMQDARVLVSFAEQELDELPAKEARPIERAKERLVQKSATAEDLAILRKFVGECQDKLKTINNPPPTPAPVPNTPGAISMPSPGPSKLDQASALPRATQLGGAKTATMSWVDVEKLAREGRFSEIPKDMLMQIDKRLLD